MRDAASRCKSGIALVSRLRPGWARSGIAVTAGTTCCVALGLGAKSCMIDLLSIKSPLVLDARCQSPLRERIGFACVRDCSQVVQRLAESSEHSICLMPAPGQ